MTSIHLRPNYVARSIAVGLATVLLVGLVFSVRTWLKIRRAEHVATASQDELIEGMAKESGSTKSVPHIEKFHRALPWIASAPLAKNERSRIASQVGERAQLELARVTEDLARSGRLKADPLWWHAASKTWLEMQDATKDLDIMISKMSCFNAGCEFAFYSKELSKIHEARDRLVTSHLNEYPGIKYVTQSLSSGANDLSAVSTVTVVLYSPGSSPLLN